jgi:hypothetical protein
MRDIWLKGLGSFLFCGVFHVIANAGEALPAHLTGSWGTGASLYEGGEKQSEMHLRADGFGLLAGSGSAPRRVDGVDDGKPAPRAIIGFPVRAELNGTKLAVHLVLPKGVQASNAGSMGLACRYEVAGPALICQGPDGEEIKMLRRSETVAVDVLRTIDAVRASGD